MARRVLNLDEVEYRAAPAVFAPPTDSKQRFEARTGQVAGILGARKLGYNITEIAPGAAAFPFHNHRVNEEMFFVLEGNGELRLGDERLPLRSGDFIACPPGDETTAHQILNTGSQPLRVLAVSTVLDPEICEYPDSGKFSVSEKRRNPDGTSEGFRHVGRHVDKRDYWEGE